MSFFLTSYHSYYDGMIMHDIRYMTTYYHIMITRTGPGSAAAARVKAFCVGAAHKRHYFCYSCKASTKCWYVLLRLSCRLVTVHYVSYRTMENCPKAL